MKEEYRTSPSTEDRSSFSSLRKQAEERIRHLSHPERPLDMEEANRIIHELQVHRIELELQNEELRHTQREIQDARSQYVQLYDFAPVGYLSLTEDHRIQNINLRGAFLLNQEKSALLGSSFNSFLVPESHDAFYLFIKSTLKESASQSIILKVKPHGKEPIWLEMEGVRREAPEGMPLVFLTFQDVTKRIQIEEELKESLRQKEILLRELNHRVKNNLQMISSLMYLQGESVQDPNLLRILENLQNRIRSIALVHEMLYKGENLGSIQLSQYLRSLIEELLKQGGNSLRDVEVTYSLEELPLEIDRTITLGLLVNELLMNALKHAFSQRSSSNPSKGNLFMQLRSISSDSGTSPKGELVIRDNGPGLPEQVLRHEAKDSLGIQLLQAFVQKLRGTLEMWNEGGAVFRIQFPL